MASKRLLNLPINFKRKTTILIALILFLFLFDLALFLLDLLVGEERGVVFSFRLEDIILATNLGVVLLITSFFILFFIAKKFQYVKKYLINLSLTLVALLVVVLLVECIFFVLIKVRNSNTPPGSYSVVIDENVFKRDEILGFGLNENASNRYKNILISPKNDTTVIYDNQILTDSAGFRKVDLPGMHERRLYALFFGCSFTFGTGVNGNETIPYLFTKYDANYCSYNFAVSGYGTQSMLAQLQYKKLRSLVKQDSGICFYIYIPDHIPRVIGDMRIFNSFGTDLPYYDYENGEITYEGTFRNGRPITSSFYYLMGKSNFLRYFQINFPIGRFNSHYKKTCDIINQAYAEYKSEFKNDNFYVIIYPGDDTIVNHLAPYGIKTINFSHLFDTVDKNKYFHPNDGHPTRIANQHLSTALIKSIDPRHDKN